MLVVALYDHRSIVEKEREAAGCGLSRCGGETVGLRVEPTPLAKAKARLWGHKRGFALIGWVIQQRGWWLEPIESFQDLTGFRPVGPLARQRACLRAKAKRLPECAIACVIVKRIETLQCRILGHTDVNGIRLRLGLWIAGLAPAALGLRLVGLEQAVVQALLGLDDADERIRDDGGIVSAEQNTADAGARLDAPPVGADAPAEQEQIPGKHRLARGLQATALDLLGHQLWQINAEAAGGEVG
jgi:hypothetical protein